MEIENIKAHILWGDDEIPSIPIYAMKAIVEKEIERTDKKISNILSVEGISVDEVGKKFIAYQESKKSLTNIVKTLDKLSSI